MKLKSKLLFLVLLGLFLPFSGVQNANAAITYSVTMRISYISLSNDGDGARNFNSGELDAYYVVGTAETHRAFPNLRSPDARTITSSESASVTYPVLSYNSQINIKIIDDDGWFGEQTIYHARVTVRGTYSGTFSANGVSTIGMLPGNQDYFGSNIYYLVSAASYTDIATTYNWIKLDVSISQNSAGCGFGPC